ncbi:ubiquinol-cytochrome C chaperone family protein [Sphingomonas jaspsi]|uniref:ubiquinol-cytochrome C chaperone family protein n=1 Tax=Sphingomonas jaspsi TaxID=392409 RepID=UPI0004B3AD45|nr:ubiquinol-cytochrome C chaperone family protein [Sphingomonas jaspsi]
MRSLMAMLRPKTADAGALYDAVIAEARRPAWYREGKVPDSLDGRFAVLATLTALVILRLEDGDEDCVRHSVALTESFIADMDAQMRQEGFGDPSIGKQVRSMVGALATRVDRWRNVRAADEGWLDATIFSVYKMDSPDDEGAVTFATESVKSFNEHLSGRPDRDVREGRIA